VLIGQGTLDAYIQLIREANHTIYIENQFFITSTIAGHPVHNQIGAALAERIISAARDGRKFKVRAVSPLPDSTWLLTLGLLGHCRHPCIACFRRRSPGRARSESDYRGAISVDQSVSAGLRFNCGLDRIDLLIEFCSGGDSIMETVSVFDPVATTSRLLPCCWTCRFAEQALTQKSTSLSTTYGAMIVSIVHGRR
jgi:hypothetical protein